MREVVLCADEEALRNPSMIGLDGESLDSQEWLLPLSNAHEAREYLRDGEADEVWVASSDEVDPINLAAALKRERREMRVCLVAWQGSGSLMSRANAAGIDEVIGYREMAQRYALMKGRHRTVNPRRRTPATALAEKAALAARERPEGAHRSVPVPVPDPLPRSAPIAEVPDEEPAVVDESPAHDAGSGAGGHSASIDAPVKRGYALCVVSASGGTGKSTVAALSALIASGHGYRTAIIDADLQFGDIASMFGEAGTIPVDKAIADPTLLTAAHANGPVVVSSLERMEQSEIYLPQVPGLIDWARERFDVVVVNTGSFWSESHVQMIEVCTNTLFLMDQRPTSVKAVRKALELCARCGVAAHPFLFAVNRCTRKSLLSSIDISCALDGVPVVELKEGGSSVAELMSAGLAMRLIEEHNDLCVSLNDFLGDVIPAALNNGVPKPAPIPELQTRAKGKSKRKSSRRKGRAACL